MLQQIGKRLLALGVVFSLATLELILKFIHFPHEIIFVSIPLFESDDFKKKFIEVETFPTS